MLLLQAIYELVHIRLQLSHRKNLNDLSVWHSYSSRRVTISSVWNNPNAILYEWLRNSFVWHRYLVVISHGWFDKSSVSHNNSIYIYTYICVCVCVYIYMSRKEEFPNRPLEIVNMSDDLARGSEWINNIIHRHIVAVSCDRLVNSHHPRPTTTHMAWVHSCKVIRITW